MKIAAHVGVLDEVEVIERTLVHLRSIGVDEIVVFDMGSTDGTLQVLDRLQSAALRVFRMPNETRSDRWQQAAIESLKEVRCDWALFLDADEFWLPAAGSIKKCGALVDADVLIVDRFNVPLVDYRPAMPSGDLTPDRYDELFVYCPNQPDFFHDFHDSNGRPWISGVPQPKVMARIEEIATLTTGSHDVVSSPNSRKHKCTEIVIAHVPFSTEPRFERKIRNVKDFLRLRGQGDFVGDQGWHWRRWSALDEGGLLKQEYERQNVTTGRLQELRLRSAVVSVADLFRARQGQV